MASEGRTRNCRTVVQNYLPQNFDRPFITPDGEMWTPSMRKESVASILGMMCNSWWPSEVICSVPGAVVDVCITGLPFSHLQDRRNQKHLERFSAPPVLYRSFSHRCAKFCRLVTSWEWESPSLVPNPVSSTKASPTKQIVVGLCTGLIVIRDTWLPRDMNIRMKHKSHKKGPMVDPCPGPYNKQSDTLL